jgi:hypothetical protein
MRIGLYSIMKTGKYPEHDWGSWVGIEARADIEPTLPTIWKPITNSEADFGAALGFGGRLTLDSSSSSSDSGL